MTIEINQPVPDFTVPSTAGHFTLSEHRGQKVVVYFYPKDNTPGCTLETENFRDQYADFRRAGCIVVGISRDSVRSHERFKAQLAAPFDLLSDESEAVCQLFDVIKIKNMYGKQVQGIERSTFLIDEEGVLRQQWRGVKVSSHVDAVLQVVRTLSQPA
ncbi:MAG: peroxiredoxin [Burkholderiaceae bacterium]|jgi:peroxiredoxin Q/BCP